MLGGAQRSVWRRGWRGRCWEGPSDLWVAVGGLGGRRSRGYSTLVVDGQPGAVDGRLGGELRAAEVRGGEGQPDGCQGSWGSPSEKARLGPMEGVEPVADDNEKPRLLSSKWTGPRALWNKAAGQQSVGEPECPTKIGCWAAICARARVPCGDGPDGL